MLLIYRFISGFLRVRFYGEYRERILNLCAVNGITLWNSKFTPNGIESSIIIRDFRCLRSIIRKKGVRVHILRKSGLPFIINLYRKRWGILIGVIAFFLIIEVMSGFIWVIDIEGNKRVSNQEIYNACRRIGITEGMRADSIIPKIERERLLLELEDLSWASLNIEGSRLTVIVSESKNTQDKNSTPSNIKAKCDGIIEKIDITSGNSVVKVGDTVKRGDVLVSGIIETADSTRFVKSEGTVTAMTEREIVLTEKFQSVQDEFSGEQKKKYVLEFFTLKIPLYLGSEQGDFDSELKVSEAVVFENRLPIRLYKKTFLYKTEKNVKYNYDQLCKRLEESLIKKLEEEKAEKIEVINQSFTENEDGVTMRAVVRARKNIGYTDFLLINTGN